MSSIEITDNTIVRSLIRKGDDTSRLRITLLSGELGYTTDTKRLFVGDGVTPGGVISGNKYLGSASEGGGVASLNVQPGDLVVNNGNLYARNVDGSGNPVQFDGDDAGFTKIGNTANIDGNGLKIDADNNLNVLVDNATIEIDSASEELKVKEVPLNKLEEGAANSIVANGNDTLSTPSYIPVNDSSVLGRLDSLAGLTSISFNDVIFNANSPTLNGDVTIKSLEGTGTRIVQANSSGVLQTVSGTAGTGIVNTGSGFINFLETPIVIYNPPYYKQGTNNWPTYADYLSLDSSGRTPSTNKFLTYPGDATFLANAKNIILETVLLCEEGKYYSFNVSVRTDTGQGTNNMGYTTGFNRADNSKDRGFGVTQSIVPCNANGSFQFNVNVRKGELYGWPIGAWSNPAWGTANSGVIIRIVGYTL